MVWCVGCGCLECSCWHGRFFFFVVVRHYGRSLSLEVMDNIFEPITGQLMEIMNLLKVKYFDGYNFHKSCLVLSFPSVCFVSSFCLRLLNKLPLCCSVSV
jgi:hypothetical protein